MINSYPRRGRHGHSYWLLGEGVPILLFVELIIEIVFVSRQRKEYIKIWIPDLKLVLDVLVEELGMTYEQNLR